MIRVKDKDESLKFYTELFNMKLVEQRRLEDCTLYFLNDESGEVQIELTYNDDTPKDGYQNGKAFGHFAFSCDDMDKFSEKLHSMGYEYLYEPFDLTGKGSNIAFINDPDGNEIEIIEKVVW
jgi:lactoylglutathione lyase